MEAEVDDILADALDTRHSQEAAREEGLEQLQGTPVLLSCFCGGAVALTPTSAAHYGASGVWDHCPSHAGSRLLPPLTDR